MIIWDPRKWDIIGKLRILMISFITVIIVGALIIGFRWMTTGQSVDVAHIVFETAIEGEAIDITTESAELIADMGLVNTSISAATSKVNVAADENAAAGAAVDYQDMQNVIEIQAESITDAQYKEISTRLQGEYGTAVDAPSAKYAEASKLVTKKISGQPWNWGLDFTGGTIVELTFEEPFIENGEAMADSDVITEVRGFFSKHGISVGSIQVQRKTGSTEAGVKIANSLLIRTQEASQTKLQTVIDDLHERFGEEIEDQQRIDTIGPVIGEELKATAWKALLWALSIIFLYIAFRFEPKASVAAIACLVHDLFFVLGALSLFWVELNLAAVAALLAMISYDVQDTVVIMDRVRENSKLWLGKITYPEMINLSITQTYMRSFNTSVTTLFAILVLLFFGGRTILDFTLILFLGLLAGTFSSIYIAAPMLVVWKNASARYSGGEIETYNLSDADTTPIKEEVEAVVSDAPVKKVQPVKKSGPPPKKRRPGQRKKKRN